MTITDIIILIIVVIILSLIIYFSFIKNKGNSCKRCSIKGKKSLVKEYYKNKCRGNLK